MRNAEIATALDELGDLYELDGAVVYRVVAYRQAARSVRESPRSVEQLVAEGRATELPHVGKTLQETLAELREAAGAERLRDISALGPKAEQNVIEALDRFVESGPRERLLLSAVLTIGETNVTELRRHPAADRVEIAGSA